MSNPTILVDLYYHSPPILYSTFQILPTVALHTLLAVYSFISIITSVLIEAVDFDLPTPTILQ